MDAGLVSEIIKLIESAKGHAVFFMNDPPSRAWSGWRGRSDSCIKKAKQICEQTLFAFEGLVKRTNLNINEFREQQSNDQRTIQNLKSEISTLRNSHNSVEQNLNSKIMEKQNDQIDRDRKILNLSEEVTMLKKVLNQKDKNQAKLKQRMEDLETKYRKSQFALKEAKQEMRKAYNQQDKYTEVSIKPSSKDMSKPPTEKSFHSSSETHKSNSEKNFHYEKPMECFSFSSKHSYLKLKNYSTVVSEGESNNKWTIILLESDIDRKREKVLGFKVMFVGEMAAGMCSDKLAKGQGYELHHFSEQQKIAGLCEIVKRRENDPGQMFVGLKYSPKTQEIKIMKASKQGKKEYTKTLTSNLFDLNMKPCIMIRGRCEISLIDQ